MPENAHVSDEQVHYRWDVGNEPVLGVASGDTVVLTIRDVSDNQVAPGGDASVLDQFD